MRKLLLTYMIGLTILGISGFIILSIVSSAMWQRNLINVVETTNFGVLQSLQTELTQYPEQQWPNVIEKLQPIHGNPISIVSLKNAQLSNEQRHTLLNGEVVINPVKSVYFLGYGTSEIFTYQLIGDSQYAIKLDAIPVKFVAQQASAWMVKLIQTSLQQTPREQWPQKIKQLEHTYSLPLTLMSLSDSAIPQHIKHSLSTENFAHSDANTNNNIDYIYIPIHIDQMLIRIGPIPNSIWPQHWEGILMAAFFILAIIFVILMTIFFSRNLEKIYRLTEQYSHADFSPPTKFSKYSTLKTLHDNIVNMGNKIKTLMNTQRNLTQFVAHECRTPVSTMLFSIDSLEKTQLTQDQRKHIQSVKEDLSDLNGLVSEFLDYARFNQADLKLNVQSMNVNQWMNSCIAKYNNTPIAINLSSSIDTTTQTAFDPKLMRHVVNNLLDNALKHAQSKIAVSIQVISKDFVITVEDDGQMISSMDKEVIFTPFICLDHDAIQKKSGYGLGLHIAQTIVKQHCGSIAVFDSTLGGTQLVVTIPVK